MYDDAISRIESQNQDYRSLAEKALRWVAYAYRPLSVEALQEPVSIEVLEVGEQESEVAVTKDFDDEGIHSISSILDVCAGLLIHDEENGIVRPVHYTAQDYFDAHAGSRFDEAHTCIARECITYLSYECFQHPIGSKEDRLREDDDGLGANFETEKDFFVDDGTGDARSDRGSRYYYLFNYANTFWAQHATMRQDSVLSIDVHQFLARKSRVSLFWTSGYSTHDPFILPKDARYLEARHGWEVAAHLGLYDELYKFCKEIKEAGAVPHLRTDFLLRTVGYGETKPLEILLEYCADIECKENDGDTALLQRFQGRRQNF